LAAALSLCESVPSPTSSSLSSASDSCSSPQLPSTSASNEGLYEAYAWARILLTCYISFIALKQSKRRTVRYHIQVFYEPFWAPSAHASSFTFPVPNHLIFAELLFSVFFHQPHSQHSVFEASPQVHPPWVTFTQPFYRDDLDVDIFLQAPGFSLYHGLFDSKVSPRTRAWSTFLLLYSEPAYAVFWVSHAKVWQTAGL